MSDRELENIDSSGGSSKTGAGNEDTSDSIDRKDESEKLKTKPVPAVVTLLGGAAVAIDVWIQKLPMRTALITILISLLVFMVIGDIIKLKLDRIVVPKKKEVDDEGEMIEKGSSKEPEELSLDDGDLEDTGGTEESFNGTEDVMTDDFSVNSR